MKLIKKIKQLKKIKPFKNTPRDKTNEVWKKTLDKISKSEKI